jgi:putative membrane protein
MHRRNALTLIALGAVAPTFAMAQERGFGEAAQRYMLDTLEVGGIALATSRIATERARDPWVKKFALYETEEQERVAAILQSLGAQPPSNERLQKQDAVRQLGDLQGTRFEVSFLQAQEEGHEKLLRIQDQFIGGGQNRDLQNVAKLIKGRVQEHIDLIRTIRQQIHA